MRIKNKPRFLSLVLGNIIMCATVLALVLVTADGGSVSKAGSAEPYYSGKSDGAVSLMINVYWGTEYIPQMLDTLQKYDVKTTFFVGGSWASANRDTLKSIRNAGHEIANHGYYHKDHKKLDKAGNIKEIRAAHDAVKDILGIDMTLFAPPSGAFGDDTLAAASELGYKTIMWTRDTIDWRDKDPDLIYRRAVKNVKGGDLVLMHPTESTAKALEHIITTITALGYRIAPVSSVILGNRA